MPKYNRILLKLSGEALAGAGSTGFDHAVVEAVCARIKMLTEMGVQTAVVVGGGNFWRGRSSGEMNRTTADHMGMLATMMNSLMLSDTLEQMGVSTLVQSPIHMQPIAKDFSAKEAVAALEEGKVVLFGCGTGSPYFSTDTTAALRGAEIGADIVLKATMVDGVYDSDPKKNPSAKRYEKLSFATILKNELRVMDSTAASICKENNIKFYVFDLNDPENIIRAVNGENIGTIVE